MSGRRWCDGTVNWVTPRELYRACPSLIRSGKRCAAASGGSAPASDALVYPFIESVRPRSLKRCVGRFDVYLSVSSLISAPHLHQLVDACDGNILISQFPNCGYDIYPLLRMITDPDLQLCDHYRWILKLHSKRSDHRSDGNQWSEALQDALCDLDLNDIHPQVGMVTPRCRP